MYFKDLTPYSYLSDSSLKWNTICVCKEFPLPMRDDIEVKDLEEYNSTPKMLNVGWLSNGHPFPTGNVSEEFLEKLNFLRKFPKHLCDGWHDCEFCDGDEKGNMADGEIHLTGEGNITYAAPIMTYHYVSKHGYLPPQAFISAVCTSLVKVKSSVP